MGSLFSYLNGSVGRFFFSSLGYLFRDASLGPKFGDVIVNMGFGSYQAFHHYDCNKSIFV